MNKPQLIRLIHVARRELQLDEETYRAFLLHTTNCDSCKKLKLSQLEDVYEALKNRGFKRKFKKNTAPRVRVPKKTVSKTALISKIRAIWITLGQQGFIKNSSELALDAYVERQTKNFNGGIGIKTAGWLDAESGYFVLESIKKWHARLMAKIIGYPVDSLGYDKICAEYDCWLRRLREIITLSNLSQ